MVVNSGETATGNPDTYLKSYYSTTPSFSAAPSYQLPTISTVAPPQEHKKPSLRWGVQKCPLAGIFYARDLGLIDISPLNTLAN
jgi:hypothetical protein